MALECDKGPTVSKTCQSLTLTTIFTLKYPRLHGEGHSGFTPVFYRTGVCRQPWLSRSRILSLILCRRALLIPENGFEAEMVSLPIPTTPTLVSSDTFWNSARNPASLIDQSEENTRRVELVSEMISSGWKKIITVKLPGWSPRRFDGLSNSLYKLTIKKT